MGWGAARVSLLPAPHLAQCHKVDVGGAVRQLRLLLYRQGVVAVVTLNASPRQQLLLLNLAPRPAPGVSRFHPPSLLLPSSLHCSLPRLLPHPRPLLLLAPTVPHAQAQRPLLESDVGKTPSPAVHRRAHLRHAHVHAALQDAAPDSQPQGEVFLDRPRLEEVVGVAAVHGEAHPSEVDGAVQDGRNSAAVLAGHSNDLRAHSAVRDCKADAGAEDGGPGAKGRGVRRSVAGGAHGLRDQR